MFRISWSTQVACSCVYHLCPTAAWIQQRCMVAIPYTGHCTSWKCAAPIYKETQLGLKHVEYAERLQQLNLHSLELRRLRTDLGLIWCYKIVFGLVRLNFGDFLKYCPVSTTRGHPYKLYICHTVLASAVDFFPSRNKSVEQSTAVFELLVTSRI